jgi:hypothetical protein
MNAKRKLKNIGYPKSYAKKSDYDPPFWIDSQFLTDSLILDSCC